MRRALLMGGWAGALLALAGCEAGPEPRFGAHHEAQVHVTAPAASGEGADRTFGTAPDEQRPLTALSAILAEPSRYSGQVVRTEGEIAQVCQRMGCWMELREGAEGERVRVPMAGHSFFLPRDVAGRRAMLEGRVALRELTPDVRAHLESEGASATASALSIEASGVVVR